MMQIHQANLTQLTINGVPRLDPIRVIAENESPGRGRITITCYGMSWTAYWGGMGDQTVEQFFVRTGADYLMGRLFRQCLKKDKKVDEAYLMRIVEAVQSGFLQLARDALSPVADLGIPTGWDGSWRWMTHPDWNFGEPMPVQTWIQGGTVYCRPFDCAATEFEWAKRDNRWKEVPKAKAVQP